MLIISKINSSAGDVESIATNLAIGDVLKIKTKEKKMIRERNTKTENLMAFATTVVKKGIFIGTVGRGRTAKI